jgi:hypothetical protein
MTGPALLLGLALGASGLALPPPARPAAATAAAGERAEIAVHFRPWQFTGTFTLSLGERRDQGVARDRGSLVGPRRQVERVLEGARGTLILQLDTELRGAFFPHVVGRWRVTGATGAYAGLSGGGTFTAADAGTSGGSPFGFQTLLGRLTPRR